MDQNEPESMIMNFRPIHFNSMASSHANERGFVSSRLIDYITTHKLDLQLRQRELNSFFYLILLV